MIIMQYSFTLPADYDMDIIDRRVKDKGPMLDQFPGLNFKAYLFARRDDNLPSRENLYAPFYVWDDEYAVSNFLCGPGFEALCLNFGRPTVYKWLPWAHHGKANIATAQYASRVVKPIPVGADLHDLRTNAVASLNQSFKTDQNILATVTGFDPHTWTEITFNLYADEPVTSPSPDLQLYHVGHVSTG